MALTKINSHNIQVGAIEASALELSGVTAGSYGSASSVPVITVNQHGLVTGVTTSAVAGVSNVTYANDVLTVSTSSGTNYPVTITQYTDARARSAISATGSLSYNSTTGVISFTQGNTDTVAEGSTNLYYTNARARAAISATGSLSYNSSTGVISFTQGNTDTVAEGTTNLYYTNARARTAISVSGSLSYNSTTGVISYTTPTTIASLSNHTTSNLAEGTNLYYTDARVGTYLTNNAYATQTYVNTAVSNLVAAAPTTLDTLNELATALGNDPNFATTIATSIGTKVSKSGDTMTGALTVQGTTILANAFRFYTGGKDGDSTYGDFRTNPATGNSIISAKSNALYFNYDHGTGGVIFCNGAEGTVGTVDASGNANFNGAITQNSNQVLHAGNYNSYAPTLTGTGASGTWNINVNGKIAVSAAAATATDIMTATIGSDDFARIRVGSDSYNTGWLEIATADDATEPIYVRQYNGQFTSIARTLTLLDASGNTIIPGSVGIGFSSPDQPLAFADSLGVKIQFNGNNANGYQVGLASSLNGGDAMMKFTAGETGSGEFGFYNTSNLRVFINASGSVGIATSSPAAKFHLNINAPSSIGAVPSGTSAIIDNTGNNYLLFRNSADNGSYSGVIMQDNNVGGYLIFGNSGAGDQLYIAGYNGGELQYGTADSIDPAARTTILKWGSGGFRIYNDIKDRANFTKASTYDWHWLARRYDGYSGDIRTNIASYYWNTTSQPLDTRYLHTNDLNSVTYIGENIWGDVHQYRAWAVTHIYVVKAFTVSNVTLNGDDPYALYIDKSYVTGSDGCCTGVTYSYTFLPGWHRIEMIYSEGGGGHFVQLGWNIKDYTAYIAACTPFGFNSAG